MGQDTLSAIIMVEDRNSSKHDCESLEIFQSVHQCSKETLALIHLCIYRAYLRLLAYAKMIFSQGEACIQLKEN